MFVVDVDVGGDEDEAYAFVLTDFDIFNRLSWDVNRYVVVFAYQRCLYVCASQSFLCNLKT